MAVRAGVPLRQNNHDAAFVVGGREPLGVDHVVLGIGGVHRAGEREVAAGKAVVVDGFVGEAGHALLGVAVGVRRARRVAQTAKPVGAPFEGTHYAIGIAGGELAL